MYGLILAAGFGTRLGYEMPKALIEWNDSTLIDTQLRLLKTAGVTQVWVVVGFQADRVREHVLETWPDVQFVESPDYMDTQNSKSMLRGLQAIPEGPVLTLNADVVFDDGIVQDVLSQPDVSAIVVDPRVCGEEEMKYRVREGRIVAISKQTHGEGEAVGINFFAAADREMFVRALEYVDKDAYYERAMDHLLPFTAKPMRAVSIGNYRAMEIDFPEDLDEARRRFA